MNQILAQREATSLLFRWNDASAADFSRLLFQSTGQRIAVINLADVPFSSANPEHIQLPSDEQFAANTSYLRRSYEQMFPREVAPLKSGWHHYWNNLQRKPLGPGAIVLAHSLQPQLFRNSVFPPRLSGDRLIIMGLLLAPDRRWTPAQEWKYFTDLGNNLENFPKSKAVKDLMFLHELGHFIQLQQEQYGPQGRWIAERDADQFALEQAGNQALILDAVNPLEAKAIREVCTAFKWARTLRGFLRYDPEYHSIFDYGNLTGQFPPVVDEMKHLTFERKLALASWITEMEIRVRISAIHDKKQIKLNSSNLQQILKTWHVDGGTLTAELSSCLETWNRIASNAAGTQLLPEIPGLIGSGEITCPFTRHHADILLDASSYFCPSLFAHVPKLDRVPIATRPAPASSGARQPGESAWAFLSRTAPGRT